MTRQYAQVASSIWMDPDFAALSGDAQRLYLLAISQPNISLCGVVPYTPKRWAHFAADSSTDTIEAAVDELQDAGYVLADRSTEELWVRSFARHNAKGRAADGAQDAARSVFSERIRDGIAVEFARLGWGCKPEEPPPEAASEPPRDAPSDVDNPVNNSGHIPHPIPHAKGDAETAVSCLLSPVSHLPSPAERDTPPNPPASSGGEPEPPPPKRRTRSLARQAQHDARQAWTAEVAPAIARHGRNAKWRMLAWTRPEILAAIEAAGGWTQLCNSEPGDAQQAFCAAWPQPTGAHT